MPHQQCRAVDAAPSVNLQCIINTRQPSQHISSMDHITQELFCSCHFRGFKESRTHRMEKSIHSSQTPPTETPADTLAQFMCSSLLLLHKTRHSPELDHPILYQVLPQASFAPFQCNPSPKGAPRHHLPVCTGATQKDAQQVTRSHTLQRYLRIKEGLGG